MSANKTSTLLAEPIDFESQSLVTSINRYHKHQSIAGPRALATDRPNYRPPPNKSPTHLRSNPSIKPLLLRKILPLVYRYPYAVHSSASSKWYHCLLARISKGKSSRASALFRAMLSLSLPPSAPLQIHYLKLTRIIRHNLRAPHLSGLVSHFPIHCIRARSYCSQNPSQVLCIEIYGAATDTKHC